MTERNWNILFEGVTLVKIRDYQAPSRPRLQTVPLFPGPHGRLTKDWTRERARKWSAVHETRLPWGKRVSRALVCSGFLSTLRARRKSGCSLPKIDAVAGTPRNGPVFCRLYSQNNSPNLSSSLLFQNEDSLIPRRSEVACCMTFTSLSHLAMLFENNHEYEHSLFELTLN